MNETQPTTLYCANHPQRETVLRCNRCEKPICTQCAVQTPTGYRCRECVRGQQKIFETAHSTDYILAFFLAFALSLAGSFVASILGFFTIFIAPIAGVIVAEVVRFAVRKRRSRTLFIMTAAAVALGSLPLIGWHLISLSFIAIIWQVVYAIMVTSSAYYRLSGIELRF